MMVCYVLIASILSLDVVVPVKGQQGLPNFVIVLTDDQDLVLNGMVGLFFVLSGQMFIFLIGFRFHWSKLNNSWQTTESHSQML